MRQSLAFVTYLSSLSIASSVLLVYFVVSDVPKYDETHKTENIFNKISISSLSTAYFILLLHHISDSTFLTFLPVLLQSLQISIQSMGIIYTSCAMLCFILSACSVSHKLTQHYGSVPTCTIGLFLSSIALSVIFFTHKKSSVIFSLGIYFLGVTIYNPSVNRLLLESVNMDQRGLVLGRDELLNTA